MRRFAIGFVALLVVALVAVGGWFYLNEQIADPDYEPSIAAAAPAGGNARVAIDTGHSNFHQPNGRFAPFAKLARHGGYAVEALDATISKEALDADILVIANAQESLSEGEIEALLDWVEQGGSLLLIADHAPFGGFAKPLAERLGVTMGDGFVLTGPRDDLKGTIDFRAAALGDHPIIARARNGRSVSHVRSFTGQSLQGPEAAAVLLTLPDGAMEFADRSAAQGYMDGGPQGTDVGGLAQALAFDFGKGRVVVSGEAAMFTSQRKRWDRGRGTMGVGEMDNEAFVLNVLDWLARRES